jgi:hypothetical protein
VKVSSKLAYKIILGICEAYIMMWVLGGWLLFLCSISRNYNPGIVAGAISMVLMLVCGFVADYLKISTGLSRSIDKAFAKAIRRGWKEIYVAIDIHDTVMVGNYDNTQLPTTWCSDEIEECLKYLSGRPDVVLIIFTYSHDKELVGYLEHFKSLGINFAFANENPAIVTKPQGLGNYTKKMYFDLLLEDKAGFEPKNDWFIVSETFKQHPIL